MPREHARSPLRPAWNPCAGRPLSLMPRGRQSPNSDHVGSTYVGILHRAVSLHHLALPVDEELWKQSSAHTGEPGPDPGTAAVGDGRAAVQRGSVPSGHSHPHIPEQGRATRTPLPAALRVLLTTPTGKDVTPAWSRRRWRNPTLVKFHFMALGEKKQG